MQEMNYIVREPLLDPKERVLGFELTWQQNDAAGARLPSNALAEFTAAQLHDPESGWQLGDSMLFLEADPVSLSAAAIEALPASSIVFTLNAMQLADAETMAAARLLRGKGFGIAVKYADLAGQEKGTLAIASHIQIRFSSADVAGHAKLYAALKQSSIRMVARQIGNWQEFDSCAALGLNAFIGNLYLTPRQDTKAKGLNPAQAMILQLMQLVKQNADIRRLEEILKRDAALSYKLLRYINSVGFGLGAEIQSLRHAVTMLGYSPLYRWLSLLLATASTAGSHSLMQAAIVRGRFAELIGQEFLPKNEAENLFVTGMFSLLDRLLGIPMEQVLETIQLSDAVSEALLTRSGVYGPFLALAEACEFNNGQVGPLAEALFINANQVNQAHMAALAWAQSLKL